MLAKKIITAVVAGTFALSGLALTACSDSTSNDIKEKFLEEPLFTEEDSTTYTVSEPYELVDYRCDTDGLDGKITAKVKNNICEMVVKADAIRLSDKGEEPDYSFDYENPEITDVYQIVTRVPEDAVQYDPDIENQEIVYENSMFKSKVRFNNPPLIYNELVMTAELSNDYRPMCETDEDLMPYTYEYGCNHLEGTWVNGGEGVGAKTIEIKSNGETMDLTMKIDKELKSDDPSDYIQSLNAHVPPQTVTLKDVKPRVTSYGTVEFDFPEMPDSFYEVVKGKKSKVFSYTKLTMKQDSTDSISFNCEVRPVDQYYASVDLTDFDSGLYHKQQ